jgi:hypothetical protein
MSLHRLIFTAWCWVAVILSVVSQPSFAALSDVTDGFTVARTALIFNRVSNTYDSRVTLTNKTNNTFIGPLHVVVDTVPVGVSLANGVGITESGKAYVTFVEDGGQVSPGQSVTGILKFHNPQRLKFTASLMIRAELGTSVPDPGEPGKLTLAGIDINNNQVRDDVEVYIETTVSDSARHREALKGYAVAVQRALLSQSKSDAIQAGTAEVRSIECLTYLEKRKLYRWKDVLARMLNTEQRLRAFDIYNDRVNGEVFAALPDSQYRSACNFDVEALPN